MVPVVAEPHLDRNCYWCFKLNFVLLNFAFCCSLIYSIALKYTSSIKDIMSFQKELIISRVTQRFLFLFKFVFNYKYIFLKKNNH